ncbi:AraC family transcriptional regulator ligand-binding domain-containing protein [Sandaracinobacteroides saxicola]|uniref:AraC family transcriptional regulator ligand-binding domain-containing protein n=2 Tax=Sandaracinobacteroides saxicola TaxID=2759707 RepID=A0A7G5IMP7_9SPHN|nr:AraC family transcriptional regulator ligand-binding domain-containing protein [Sandaracinobacteroides saxicola]
MATKSLTVRSSADGPTVSAGYAAAVIDVAVARGADRGALLRLVCHDPADNGPDARVPFGQFKALMQGAVRLCDDPAFGLHFGAESVFRDISIVGLIAHASATMAEAFAQMNRYSRLAIEVPGHGATGRFALVRFDGELWIEDCRPDAGDFPELTEATLARFISNTRRFMPDVPFAKAACVRHARPAHAAAYDAILRVPVRFGAGRNAIAIHESWLSVPIPNANRYVFGLFSERAQALMDALLQAQTVRGRVEAAILPLLHSGDIPMPRIAALMGRSRTSLYRDLKAEGVTFDALVDALRHRMALHYLAGRRLSVGEVAYLLGFADPSSFTRAFRRWTGQSPGAGRGE